VNNILGITQRHATIGVMAAMMAAGAGWASPALAASGWQGVASFTFPTGQVSQQVGYNCPTAFPVAHSGSFAMNAAGQVASVFLTYNGTRIDIPSFSEWAWHFYFPNGAPAGVTAQFDVYCAKK
jgi:hypothetical protein